MKKKLLITAVVLVFISAGIGAFIATFDINLYKGLIASKIEAATGNHVEIGRLSLKWTGNIVLGVYDLKIYDKDGSDRAVLLSLDRADAAIELLPLMAKHIDVSPLSLTGLSVSVTRTKEKKVEISGYDRGAASAAPAKTSEAVKSPGFSVNIGATEIKDSVIRYSDADGQAVTDIAIRKIDARIDRISGEKPVKFDVKMAVASQEQNIVVSGTVGGFSSGRPFIRDLKADADLARMDLAELIKSSPFLAKLGLKSALAGKLKIAIRDFELSGDKVSRLSADISLAGGRVILSKLSAPIERIDLSASCEGHDVTVRSFSFDIASGSLTGSGTFKDIFADIKTNLKTTIEVRGIKQFISEALGQTRNMDGNARLTFEGSMSGISWKDISRTLTGKGEFYLDRARMMNTNVLNQTLGSLTLFPGLPEMVRGYVPAPIQQAFGNNDTAIEPLRQAYFIEGGYVMMPEINLKTDTFDMQGEAKTSLNGDVSGNGMMTFAQSVSDAMVKAAPEMKYLTNSQGMVQFPMAFKAGEGGFKVIPDMKYVGKKVAVEKAGQMVTDFLQKNSKEGPGGKPNAATAEKAQEIKDLVNSFIDGKKKF